MKRLPSSFVVLTLATLLLLPGCFGGGDEVETTDETTAPEIEQLAFYRLVEADEFLLQVPEDWETITQFTSAYPKNTLVAFRNNNKDGDFVANINIVRNDVEDGTTSSDYALETFEGISGQLVNYQLNNEETFDLVVGNTVTQTFLYEFEGTNDPTTETIQFIQIYAVSGAHGYIVTGSYSEDDTELAIDQVKQSVRSFRLK